MLTKSIVNTQKVRAHSIERSHNCIVIAIRKLVQNRGFIITQTLRCLVHSWKLKSKNNTMIIHGVIEIR